MQVYVRAHSCMNVHGVTQRYDPVISWSIESAYAKLRKRLLLIGLITFLGFVSYPDNQGRRQKII